MSSLQEKFLSHSISDERIRVIPCKTVAVGEIQEPANISELQSLGDGKQAGQVHSSAGGKKGQTLARSAFQKNNWIWNEDQVKTFNTLKERFTEYGSVLALYDIIKETKSFSRCIQEWSPVFFFFVF